MIYEIVSHENTGMLPLLFKMDWGGGGQFYHFYRKKCITYLLRCRIVGCNPSAPLVKLMGLDLTCQKSTQLERVYIFLKQSKGGVSK